jgi:ATP-dependent Clp protease adaptor protein ClpS
MPRQPPRASSAQPGVVEETRTDERTELARPWKVVVHDDPITLMNYVTMVLRRIFGYPQEKAHTLMMEVHTKGRSVVWAGAREQAEMYVLKLHAAQLLATMEPDES